MSLMNAASSVTPASSRSRTERLAPWRRRVSHLRLAAGPLALLGFFLPWASGPGALAGTQFTGFTLVGFAGRLQALDLSIAAGGTLLAVRLALLAIAVAATWQTLLAPAHRHHFGYRVSGWYLAGAAGVLVSVGVARSGLVVPPAGLACLLAAAVLFIATQATTAGLRDHQHASER